MTYEEKRQLLEDLLNTYAHASIRFESEGRSDAAHSCNMNAVQLYEAIEILDGDQNVIERAKKFIEENGK